MDITKRKTFVDFVDRRASLMKLVIHTFLICSGATDLPWQQVFCPQIRT